MKEFHKFSNGVEVSVTDDEVKVYAGHTCELTHPSLNKKYRHAAVFFGLKK